MWLHLSEQSKENREKGSWNQVLVCRGKGLPLQIRVKSHGSERSEPGFDERALIFTGNQGTRDWARVRCPLCPRSGAHGGCLVLSGVPHSFSVATHGFGIWAKPSGTHVYFLPWGFALAVPSVSSPLLCLSPHYSGFCSEFIEFPNQNSF